MEVQIENHIQRAACVVLEKCSALKKKLAAGSGTLIYKTFLFQYSDM
jgi:hypothetical protein